MVEPTDAPDEIERAIIALASTLPDTNESWTEALGQGLCDLGNARNYYVSSSHSQLHHDGGREWLFDHAWTETGVKGIRSVPLALESELADWGDQGIDHDFQKLLTTRARHRVMLFCGRDVERQFSRLIEQVREFEDTRPGDRYLLLGFEGTDYKLKPRVFVA